MANTQSTVPEDGYMDMNAYLNKYSDEEINDNPTNIQNIDSDYYDLDTLSTNIKSKHEYTALHLNIQSLPAKFDKLKLLISECNCQRINLDFIMVCETFLTDNISGQFNIPDYNMVCRNRITNRGGVAIYVNNKHNFSVREDLTTFIPGIFESILVYRN